MYLGKFSSEIKSPREREKKREREREMCVAKAEMRDTLREKLGRMV